MVDRINFTKSINSDDLATNVKLFFDQIMALYNLIGRYQGMDISTETDDSPSIRFIMVTESEEEANILYANLKDRIIPIYGHTYTAHMVKNINSIHIELIETASG